MESIEHLSIEHNFINKIEDNEETRKDMKQKYHDILRCSEIQNDRHASKKAAILIGIMCDIDDEDITRLLNINIDLLEEVKIDVIHDRIRFPLVNVTRLNTPLLTVTKPRRNKWKRLTYIVNLMRHFYSYYFPYRRTPSLHQSRSWVPCTGNINNTRECSP